jgi:ABC-type lipoprotein export system ATPase subunit
MAEPVDHLVLRDVTKRYPRPDGSELAVLDDVSCAVGRGETVAIVGPSGSGKSTLLNIVGALDSPTSGEVWLGETEVSALCGRALAAFRAAEVGFVFQEHHLLPQLTTLENALLPALALPRAEGAEPLARSLLERVGMAERLDSFPAQLSGGERQRAALVRAMVNRPQLLLCDEPTGNLDAETGAAVVSLLLELAADRGVTVLMVTHNPAHARRFGRCMGLTQGRLAAAPPGVAEGADEPV